MSESIDWKRLQELRRQRAEEPDERTIQARIERWRVLLASPDELPDEKLDDELLRLLERIQRAL